MNAGHGRYEFSNKSMEERASAMGYDPNNLITKYVLESCRNMYYMGHGQVRNPQTIRCKTKRSTRIGGN